MINLVKGSEGLVLNQNCHLTQGLIFFLIFPSIFPWCPFKWNMRMDFPCIDSYTKIYYWANCQKSNIEPTVRNGGSVSPGPPWPTLTGTMRRNARRRVESSSGTWGWSRMSRLRIVHRAFRLDDHTLFFFSEWDWLWFRTKFELYEETLMPFRYAESFTYVFA